MIDTDVSNTEMKTHRDMMTLFKKIANKVTKMLTWEDDCCDNHEDGKLPVLDVKMFVDVNDQAEPIKYEFYQKSMANKQLVSAHSAMPVSVK